MPRIPTDRTGYVGYSCIGISQYVIPPVDCAPAGYKRLPYRSEQGISNYVWQDMTSVMDSQERRAASSICHVSYDPFTGSFMNLYHMCSTYTPSFIEDLCYEVVDVYPSGMLNGSSRLKLTAGEAGACISSDETSSSSESSISSFSTYPASGS